MREPDLRVRQYVPAPYFYIIKAELGYGEAEDIIMKKSFRIVLDLSKENALSNFLSFIKEWEASGVGAINENNEFVYDDKDNAVIAEMLDRHFLETASL